LSKVVYNLQFHSSLIKAWFKIVGDIGWWPKSSSWLSKDNTRYHQRQFSSHRCKGIKPICNDPTAGSPTVTLLRLVLPLNDQVWPASQQPISVASYRPPIRRSH